MLIVGKPSSLALGSASVEFSSCRSADRSHWHPTLELYVWLWALVLIGFDQQLLATYSNLYFRNVAQAAAVDYPQGIDVALAVDRPLV